MQLAADTELNPSVVERGELLDERLLRELRERAYQLPCSIAAKSYSVLSGTTLDGKILRA